MAGVARSSKPTSLRSCQPPAGAGCLWALPTDLPLPSPSARSPSGKRSPRRAGPRVSWAELLLTGACPAASVGAGGKRSPSRARPRAGWGSCQLTLALSDARSRASAGITFQLGADAGLAKRHRPLGPFNLPTSDYEPDDSARGQPKTPDLSHDILIRHRSLATLAIGHHDMVLLGVANLGQHPSIRGTQCRCAAIQEGGFSAI
jgi:hypothetical protein